MSIVQAINWKLSSTQIDAYLIFLGSSGLALILPVSVTFESRLLAPILMECYRLFFELFEKNVVLGRIWFECTWTALFGAMELAGAIALTAVTHTQLCQRLSACDLMTMGGFCLSHTRRNFHVKFVMYVYASVAGFHLAFRYFMFVSFAKTSIRFVLTSVVLAVLCYFALLFGAAMVKFKQDPTIWHCSARKFQWLYGRRALSSAPASPTLPRFQRTAPVIIAPKPRRPPTGGEPPAVFSYRSGLGLEYEIEHYKPPPTSTQVDKPMPPIPSAVVPGRTPQNMISNLFYPDYVQSALQSQPPQHAQPFGAAGIRPLPASPPPLGDWPRLDATSRPTKSKQRPPRAEKPPHQHRQEPPQQHSPPRAERSHQQQRSTQRERPPQQSPPREVLASNSLPRTRPTGPRRRANSTDRPPPLDLSNISAYNTRVHT
ncbi:uncharacterized protein LACBIDRAFT_305890 [Laccaria bicolor S238N-H82]|uniref:Predicted protein n=1 Tax=Laccaria bicolor (strain S238N-H82 / ATCC MYA-4686) TaxID=486041 RepID=B0CS65_LACBS|nr:uncharacterized protein LACBIDRAFT_305890 [Laccaria bicolor S238N-H82]EDR14249.1 predicted protein [Laccaria bicolor S238N-H82]|eukprot:XP_001874808.1 predicted protein [Laccaria bicolor S238N-H82]